MSANDLMEEKIHGYTVSHNKDAEYGADYLENLDSHESEVFFDYARNNKRGAPFRDRHNRSFTLSYAGKNNYHLERD